MDCREQIRKYAMARGVHPIWIQGLLDSVVLNRNYGFVTEISKMRLTKGRKYRETVSSFSFDGKFVFPESGEVIDCRGTYSFDPKTGHRATLEKK